MNVSFLVYLGVLLGFGEIFAHVELDRWLGERLQGLAGLTGGSALIFLLAVAALGAGVGLVLRPGPIGVLLGGALYPAAAAIGVNPWVVALTIQMMMVQFLYPQQNVVYLSAYYGTGERAFSHEQARPLALAFTAFTLISLLVSIPYWRWLGLIA